MNVEKNVYFLIFFYNKRLSRRRIRGTSKNIIEGNRERRTISGQS